MTTALTTSLIEEKRLLRYLKNVSGAEKDAILLKLNQCIFWNVLSVVLPLLLPEEHEKVVRLFAQGTQAQQTQWLSDQPEEVQLQIAETTERTLLSFEKNI